MHASGRPSTVAILGSITLAISTLLAMNKSYVWYAARNG